MVRPLNCGTQTRPNSNDSCLHVTKISTKSKMGESVIFLAGNEKGKDHSSVASLLHGVGEAFFGAS